MAKGRSTKGKIINHKGIIRIPKLQDNVMTKRGSTKGKRINHKSLS